MRNLVAALVAAALCAGCADDRITTYDAPKDAPPAPHAAAHAHGMDGTMPAPATAREGGGGALAWDAPKDWASKPPSAMRLATYEIPTSAGTPVELSVVSLPGSAGGTLANVNRWRGQVGLPPFAEGELDRHSETVASRAGKLQVVSFEGRNDAGPAAMLAAITEHGGSSWFFKATGSPEAVRAARPAILAFLKGLHDR